MYCLSQGLGIERYITNTFYTFQGFPHVKLILENKKKRIVEFIGNEDLRFIDYLNKYGLKIEGTA